MDGGSLLSLPVEAICHIITEMSFLIEESCRVIKFYTNQFIEQKLSWQNPSVSQESRGSHQGIFHAINCSSYKIPKYPLETGKGISGKIIATVS